jgi:hypothetical protein
MTFSVSPSARRNILLAATGLVVAYVRTVLQYHRYSWETVSEFLVSWFIHYIGVGLLAAIAYGVIKANEKRFLSGRNSSPGGLGMDEAFVYIPLTIIVCAIAIFVLAHWPSTGMLHEQ